MILQREFISADDLFSLRVLNVDSAGFELIAVIDFRKNSSHNVK